MSDFENIGSNSPIPALNFHLWQPCNMRCSYCFARFGEANDFLRSHQSDLRNNALAVVRAAANAGIDKITLVGGEPTLCPWLGDVLSCAKDAGIVTMLVTNGTRLTDAWMRLHGENLDWVALSVDSLNPETNRRIGRKVGSRPLGRDDYWRMVEVLQAYRKPIKINTVVSAMNWQEDCLVELLKFARPERWKVFQVLPIIGQNDESFGESEISLMQFHRFLYYHAEVRNITHVAVEANEAMQASYLMVDPMGRFFDNSTGAYRYSQPIWQVGWDTAVAEISVEPTKFVSRGGLYQWRR